MACFAITPINWKTRAARRMFVRRSRPSVDRRDLWRAACARPTRGRSGRSARARKLAVAGRRRSRLLSRGLSPATTLDNLGEAYGGMEDARSAQKFHQPVTVIAALPSAAD